LRINRTHISEAGDDPKVEALVYIAPFAPDAGESAGSLGAKDRAIQPALQRSIATRLNAAVVEVASSHVAMLSHSLKVASLIAALQRHRRGDGRHSRADRSCPCRRPLRPEATDAVAGVPKGALETARGFEYGSSFDRTRTAGDRPVRRSPQAISFADRETAILRLGLILPTGFSVMSFAPIAAFETANLIAGERFYDLRVLSEKGGHLPAHSVGR
jgi:hypothetical protein